VLFDCFVTILLALSGDENPKQSSSISETQIIEKFLNKLEQIGAKF
jgi:hypothetical protein